MDQKHILFVTQVLPYPLDSGAKVRAYYMLRHLAERHRVTLCSLVRETDGAGAVAHLSSLCEAVHTSPIRRSWTQDALALFLSFTQAVPALILRECSAGFRRAIESAVAESRPDALHVDQIKAAPHAEEFSAIPRLMDMHNVYGDMIEGMARLTQQPFRRLLLQREARLMKDYESRLCRQSREVLAVTESNAKRLREMTGGRISVTTIPICVDPAAISVVEGRVHSRTLLFLGAMVYPPNADGAVWFVRDILPLIRQQIPDVRLQIVGSRPDRELVRGATGDKAIQIAGHVENLKSHWSNAAALIVPLRAGSGMRVKILDAMAHGVPVISTRLGAEGIAVRNGEDILLAEAPEDFARAVASLLRNFDLRRSLAQNARRLIEGQYDWRKRYADVDAVYERLFA